MMKKMLKKAKGLLAGIMCASIVVAHFVPMAYADDDICIIVNGSELVLKDGKPAVIGSGTTMVPFRAIFEKLGLSVGYSELNGEVNTVYATDSGRDVAIGMQIGSNTLYKCTYSEYKQNPNILGESAVSTMPENPYVDATDRTLIPLRAVAEALGANVEWYEDSQLITVVDLYSYRDVGGNYINTDIPTFSSITGYSCSDYEILDNLDPIMYSPICCIYGYHINGSDDILAYGAALTRKNFVIIENYNEDGIAYITYESPLNNYVMLTMDNDMDYCVVSAFNTYPFYYTTEVPNYTYLTGDECDSWYENTTDSGWVWHTYTYPYDNTKVDLYKEWLSIMGFTCFKEVPGSSYTIYDYVDDDNNYIILQVASFSVNIGVKISEETDDTNTSDNL